MHVQSCCFDNINLLLIFKSSLRPNISVLKRHADEVKGFHAKPLITEITDNNLLSSDYTRTRVCNIYDLSYSVSTHVASIYANLLEQKKAFT